MTLIALLTPAAFFLVLRTRHSNTHKLIPCAALLLGIGKPFLPPKGPAWAILIIWVVSGSCGYVVDKVWQQPHALSQ